MTTLDSYVLGLAVANTPCFGYHERGNATCSECPLAERCVESRNLRAVAVAAQLVKAAKAATRAAKSAPALAPAVRDRIDDILDRAIASKASAAPTEFDIESLFGDVLKPDAPAPVAPPAPPVQGNPVPQHIRVTVMRAVIDSVCFVCSGKIPAKSEAGFIPGSGLRHMTCA